MSEYNDLNEEDRIAYTILLFPLSYADYQPVDSNPWKTRVVLALKELAAHGYSLSGTEYEKMLVTVLDDVYTVFNKEKDGWYKANYEKMIEMGRKIESGHTFRDIDKTYPAQSYEQAKDTVQAQ